MRSVPLRRPEPYSATATELIASGSPVAAQTANTWQVLQPTPHPRWDGTVGKGIWDCYHQTTQGNPIGKQYSGGTLGNGKIFYWGGGDKSYQGNDVEL